MPRSVKPECVLNDRSRTLSLVPSRYVCTECREEFHFEFKQAYYYVGKSPLDRYVAEQDLLEIPLRPAWCRRCEKLCVVEDILALRVFENAYGSVRAGQSVEYPLHTEYMEPDAATSALEHYLRWRMGRSAAPTSLCCGGTDYQLMDVAQPLLQHAGCEYSTVVPQYWFGPWCGSRTGVFHPANVRVYGPEGDLIGMLTWWHGERASWEVQAAAYPPKGLRGKALAWIPCREEEN